MKHRFVLLATGLCLSTLVSVLWSGHAIAAETGCAQANVISGNTCSNVKVEFNFSNCGPGHASKVPSRVVCKGKTITARSTSENLRGEAKFEKSEDGWGAVQWKSIATVRTFPVEVVSQPDAQQATSTAAQVAPASTAIAPDRVPSAEPPTLPIATPTVSVTVNGFIDMRYTGYRSEDSAVNEKTRSGFLLDDGALYFSVKKGNVEAMVDLPFSRNGLLPSTTADVGIAKTKTQVYGRYSFGSTMNLTFGQFDTLFGLELNDSKDRVFGNVGLAYSQTLPIVHSGAYLTYSENGFTLRAMAANPSDRQTFGSDPADSSTEYGGVIGYSNASVRSQFGFLTRAVADLSNGQSQRSLFDFLAGTTLGAFDIDFQYSVVTSPRKNILTDLTTDREDPGSALLAIATYRINEKWKVSGRFETVDSDPNGGGYADAKTYGIASNFSPEEGFTVRLEWNDTVVNRKITGSAYGESRWDTALLVSF